MVLGFDRNLDTIVKLCFCTVFRTAVTYRPLGQSNSDTVLYPYKDIRVDGDVAPMTGRPGVK